MSSLYQLDGALGQILDMIDNGDLTQEEAADQLDAMSMEFEDKAQSIGFVLANMDAQAQSIKNEIERLQGRHTAIFDKQAGLRDYLLKSMIARKLKKVETPLFTFKYKAATKVAVIDDESLLPGYCFVTVPAVAEARKMDKKEVLKALKAGDIKGAHLEDSKITLQVK